jgi:hypothetical protein
MATGARPRWSTGRVLAFCAAAAIVVTLLVRYSSLGATLKQVGAGVHNPAATTYTIPASSVTSVSVDTSGSVTVTGTAAKTVTVRQDVSYSTTPPVTTRKVTGGALALGYSCGTSRQFVCAVSYTITVPRGLAVQADSSGGSVTLTSLSGPVSAQTSTSLLTVSDLTSPTAILKSGAGGINATFDSAPKSLAASTSAGPISVEVPGSARYQVDAHAVVGVTRISVPHAATSPASAQEHTITAHSDLGSITISPS